MQGLDNEWENEMYCKKHGTQELTFSIYEDIHTTRYYCPQCVIELLGENCTEFVVTNQPKKEEEETFFFNNIRSAIAAIKKVFT